jgi:D-glycero-beta-D-manno-heptose-7-phosphate kinase
VSNNNQFIDSLFNNIKILIVGDVILDHYLIGKVDRISPEAPVPVVLHESEDFRLGGAANVALNIRAMGATPFLFSVIGNDSHGAQLLDLLKENNIDNSFIIKEVNRKTSRKTRILSKNHHLLRYDHESTSPLDSKCENQLLLSIQKILESHSIDVILFQDYNKGVLSASLIKEIISLAHKLNIKTLADPKKANFLAYKGIDYFKPNLREINEALNLSIPENNPDIESLNLAASQINQVLANKCTLITLGAKGMYFQNSQNAEIVPTKIRQVADVCGAGDTVISVLALGVAAEMNTKDLIRLSNIAGGIVCGKVGVVPVDKQLLFNEFND